MPLPLDNPFLYNRTFANQNAYDKFKLPVTNFGLTPTVAQFGDTKVVTNQPIFSYGLPVSNFKLPKSQAEIDFNAQMRFKKGLEDYKKKEMLDDKNVVTDEINWWSKKTKTQKGFIIGGGVIGIGLISFLIYKAVKR